MGYLSLNTLSILLQTHLRFLPFIHDPLKKSWFEQRTIFLGLSHFHPQLNLFKTKDSFSDRHSTHGLKLVIDRLLITCSKLTTCTNLIQPMINAKILQASV